MKLRLLAVALIVVGVAAVGFSVVKPTFGSSASTSYITAQASVGDVQAQSTANGTTLASTVYGLKFGGPPDVVSSGATTSGNGGTTGASAGSSVSWPVTSVNVEVGATVTKGEALAVADDASAQWQLDQANVALVVAERRIYLDQKSDADNYNTGSDGVSLTSAQMAVASAQAVVDAATIKAPADGLIIAVNILPGVNAPSGYAIEMSTGPVLVKASFSESDISKLKVGQSATVSVTGAGVSVAGQLTQIVPTASSAGGGSSVAAYAVIVTLTDAPATVLAGMTASVSVTTASVTNVLRVPATALQGSATAGYSVTLVNADGSTTAKSIQVGLVTTSWAQVTSGLSEGDTVVVGTVSTKTGTSSSNSNPNAGINTLTGGGGGAPVPGGGR